jgi:outer membrane receptor protein involved in Fe transport
MGLCCPFAPAEVRAKPEAPSPSTAVARIDIPAGPLIEALSELSRQTAVSIGAADALPSIRSKPVHGALGIKAALARMLAGTGYIAQRVGPTAWRIVADTCRLTPVTSPPPDAEPATIIVTATKRREVLRDLPRAISVLRPGQSNPDPALDTASVAFDVEGLTLTALGPGRNRMFLRGVADSPFDGASQSTVAVLVDDARLTYSAPDPDLRLVDVDRVELLKGPQGSLYGTGTLGGIYRIVTNRADPDHLEATVSAGLNAVDKGGVGASGSAVVNMPVVPGTAGLRLVGYAMKEPGWIDTGSRSDSNASSVAGGRANLGIEAGAGWRIDLGGLLQRIDTADSQYTYAPGARSRPAQLPEPHDNDLNEVSARAEGRIGSVDAVFATSYSWHEVRDTLDATVGATSFGLADPQLFQDFRRYTVLDSEARFSGQLGTLRWLAGLSQIEATQYEWRNLTSATPVASLVIDDSHVRASDTGLFVNATLPITGRLELEAGGRLYHTALDASRAASGNTTSDETRKTGVTPSAAIVWRPEKGRLVWLRYGAAVRQGGLDFETDGKVHAFSGDELKALEAGWREQLVHDGQFDFDAFITLWDDMQSDMLLPNGLIQTGNAGQARIVGGETSLTWPLGQSWQLKLGATAQSALLVQNRLGIALDDRRLPAIPDYTLRGGLTRVFRLGSAAGSVGLTLRYLGPARLSFDPQLDRPMGRVLDSRLDVSLNWGRTRLELKLDNLFNRASDSFAYGNPFRSATPQYTPQPPFNAAINVTHRF